MAQETRYREIEVGGTPFEMGRQIGEAARQEIRGFAAIALERVNKTLKVSRARAMEVATASVQYAEEYSAEMVEELRGTAESSGVALEELMLLQVRNQLQPDADAGCTSFAVAPQASAERRAIVGQNWDNDPALDPYTVVLTRRPEGSSARSSVFVQDLAQAKCHDAADGFATEMLKRALDSDPFVLGEDEHRRNLPWNVHLPCEAAGTGSAGFGEPGSPVERPELIGR